MKITFLSQYGITPFLEQRIRDTFGESVDIDKMIHENPYKLINVDGIGFAKADKIAKLLKIKDDDVRRIQALIYDTIEKHKAFGHTFLPTVILEKQLKKFNIIEFQEALKSADNLVTEENRIYTDKLHKAETETAQYLKRRIPTRNWNEYPRKDQHLTNLDNEQKDSVLCSLSNNLSVITGGPGTGKTHTIRALCDILSEHGLGFTLAAPTGKAAKRLQDLTGRTAKTIHRLLKANYVKWGYNAGVLYPPIEYIIIDESSMIDLELAWRLLQALRSETNIVFVGDKNQLPPVGPGSFFADLVRHKVVKSTILITNHRQGKGSSIAENSKRINQGTLQLQIDDDFKFIEAANPIEIRIKLPKLIKDEFSAYDKINDFQVLSPQKSTNTGVDALNEMLRYLLNPKAKASDVKFSVGDKVIQMQNDYKLNIFNGYIGEILDVTSYGYKVKFADDNLIVDYPKSKAFNLMLAYCTTIHKFQGSECKSGIIVVSNSHTYMWNRSLLYTAVSRFKEKCIILGDSGTLKRAVTNSVVDSRYSKLLEKMES